LPCVTDSNDTCKGRKTGDEDNDNEEGEEEDFSVPELGRVAEVPNNSHRLGFHATRVNDYENTSMREERIETNYDATNRAMGHNINYTPLQPTSYGGMNRSVVPCSNGNKSVSPVYCLELLIDGVSDKSLMLTLSPDGNKRMTVGKFARDVVEKHLVGECLMPLCRRALEEDDGERKSEASERRSGKSVSISYGDGYFSKIYLMSDPGNDLHDAEILEEDEDATIHMSMYFASSSQSPCCAPSSLFFPQLQHFLARQEILTEGKENLKMIQVILKTDGHSWITCPLYSSDDSDECSEMDSEEEREYKMIKKRRAKKRKRERKKKRRVWEIQVHPSRDSTIQKMRLLGKHELHGQQKKSKKMKTRT